METETITQEKKQRRPPGYWHNPENIELEVKKLCDELGRFPTCKELKSAYSHWCYKSIKWFYPGGRDGLARKLGYTGLQFRRRLTEGLYENGVIDPNNSKKRWNSLKERTKDLTIIEGISKENSMIICQYLKDRELGLYSSKNRKPSPCRLYKIFFQMRALAREIEKTFHKNLSGLTKKEVHELFLKHDANLQKEIMAFWNYWYKKNREEGNNTINFVEDLSQDKKENRFIYFTLEELTQILKYFTKDEQALLLFCFDTLVRTPKELSNILRRDIYIDKKGEIWVTIRAESSKTFERKFNIVLCKEEIKEYLKKDFDFSAPLFPFYALSLPYQDNFAKRLKKAFQDEFDNRTTLGGLPFSRVTLYSFRHSGTCYFQDKNVDLKKLLYRGGWKTLNRLLYYSKFLGQTGKIEDIELEDKDSKINKLLETISTQNERLEKLSLMVYNLSKGEHGKSN